LPFTASRKADRLQQAPEWLVLHGRGVSAILECYTNEAPLWRYWGTRLPDGVKLRPLRASRPIPPFSLDFDQPLSLFPGFGLGWFGQSALLAHRDGQDWSFQATQCSVAQQQDSATVRLIDDVAQIAVEISLRLDPECDVLSLSTTVTNFGDAVLDVQWLAAGVVPLPPHACTVRSFGGRYNDEFVPVEDSLTRSIWRRENRRGLTSHDCFAGALVEAENAVYGAQLAWSGNHAQYIEWIDDGRYHWQMGEWLAPGEVRLATGESIASPEMLTTCGVDTNAVAQNFHAAIRNRVRWPGGAMNPRPVHLNTWEGFYFDHDEAALMELADAAAAIGIERFVLDDGWFYGRNDDTSSLGDWWADSVKYPNGLEPLADHVIALGMEFGLWVEPEMVNPDSALFRAHPDWALATPDRPMTTGRNQLALDMTQADVGDYLFAKVAALLEELPVAYLKWDHNRDLSTAGSRPLYRKQVKATYALLDRIRSAFPHVEIEACAGGGGRIDAGIAAHAHRFWTSDNIDAVSRISIQRGFLHFMPPELMGAHVGASPSHATWRKQSMDFRAGVALPGHFGVELDVRKLDAPDRDRLAHWIATYKMHRDRLHRGKVWQGAAGDSLLWQAHGEADDLLLMLYRVLPQSWRHAPSVKLPMLDPARSYRIDGEDYHGAWLIVEGLPTQPMKAELFQLIEIKAS
jgi:alpha-galactosidase